MSGLGGHCSHLSKQFTNVAVVRDPPLVETSFVFKSQVEGLVRVGTARRQCRYGHSVGTLHGLRGE